MLDQLKKFLGSHPRVRRAREILAFAARRGRSARLDQAAATLTLTTVLSVVPLLAVALARPMVAVLAQYAARFSVRAHDVTVDGRPRALALGGGELVTSPREKRSEVALRTLDLFGHAVERSGDGDGGA